MAEESSSETLGSQVSTELSLLENHLNQLEMLIAYEHKRVDGRRGRELYDPNSDGDFEDWLQPILAPHVWVDIMYSRILRGPFLIALFSTLETTVTRIARIVRESESLTTSLDDYKKGNFLQRARKHFKNDLPFALCTTGENWQRLDDLLRLRNAIAHYNGRIDLMDEGKRSKLQQIEATREGIILGIDFIDISNEFVEETLQSVREFVNGLVNKLTEWNTAGNSAR